MRLPLRNMTLGAILASVAVVGMTPSEDVRAQVIQANVTSICGQVPSLVDALNYTIKTWPFTQERAVQAGIDTVSQLAYFGTAVQADKTFCTAMGSSNNGAALQIQPELVLNTLQWHFGNASEALAKYQKAVGAQ